MEILVGIVKSNGDNLKRGGLEVKIPALKNRVVFVTYTTPYYRMNSGGMVAIPEDGSQVLVLHNKKPRYGESSFYFHSCIVTATPRDTNEGINEDYTPLKDNDVKAKIYSNPAPEFDDKGNDVTPSPKPVTQTFTNTAGAGLYIHRDFSTPTLSNNVTIKTEKGCEVNVGPIGAQIRNEEGDFINLAGAKGGDEFASRALNIETRGPQEYKCTSSDINMKIVDGGDINIENNSTGFGGFGKTFVAPSPGNPTPTDTIPGKYQWSGNIRLKSRYRNIDLAALGDLSNINIVTNKAKIKLDGITGQVTIYTPNDIQLNSGANISLKAEGDISLDAGGAFKVIAGSTVEIDGKSSTTVKSNGAVTMQSGAVASVNGTTVALNNATLYTINPVHMHGSTTNAQQITSAGSLGSYADVVTEPPTKNDYADGFPGDGAT